MEISDLRISLRKKLLAIPYPPCTNEDGQVNHGYFSLVNDPTLAFEIAEMAKSREIQASIAHLNSGGKAFETVRVTAWTDRQQMFRSCLCLGMVFRDRERFANYDLLFQLFGRFLAALQSGEVLSDEPPLIEIQPAVFLNENNQGWIFDVYLVGHGEHEDAALQRLAQAMHTLVNFLESVS
jgi:hypothetical protein